MGYAGYSPGLRVADALSPLEQALRSLPLDKFEATLELIQKLVHNVVRNPAEEKFRKIKLTNKKIAECITEVPGAVDALKAMGWAESVGDEGPVLELPTTVRPKFEVEVRTIIDTKDFLKKEQENDKRRKMREEAAMDDPEKKALREKMEQDRKEKAAEGPSGPSVANKLGNGPNIMRAGDIGIGKSAGG